MAEASNHQAMTCRVKWFDTKKGFGFLLPEDGGPDILLHANVLRTAGLSTLTDGVVVEGVGKTWGSCGCSLVGSG